MSKRKILHVIDTFWLGGAQQVVKRLMENSGDHLHILALRKTPEMIDINHPKVTVVDSEKKWNFSLAAKTIQTIIKRENIEILHCHLPKSQTIGLYIKWKHPHITLFFQEQGDVMNPIPFNWPVYVLGRKKIELVIACSHAVSRALSHKTGFPKSKTVVLHNPPAIQAKAPVESNDFSIGFAGRITKHKGWRDLLDGVDIFAKKHPDLSISLQMAGVGPETEALLTRAKSLPSNVHFHHHGMVHNMADFYRTIKVLVVPSHLEPVGMVHLEGMLCGAAVIASNVEGMNEVLIDGENALLFPPKTPSAIARTLERLINEEARKALADNGRQSVKRYAFSAFQAALEKHYQNISTT